MKLVLALWILLGGCFGAEAHAQDSEKPSAERDKPSAKKRAQQRRETRKAKRSRARAAEANDEASAGSTSTDAADKPTKEGEKGTEATPAPPIDDGSEIRKEGDTEVKVIEFGGLDIEGQLKTPQLLYFLNRLRAEFGRPRLPHRSFMPELERSAGERPLR